MYVNENPELAGELTNKEAGFIAEILTLAALQGGKNVMQDGSLRDSDWYQTYFERLRREFPKVRQAIIHVTAPREAVFQRAEVSGDGEDECRFAMCCSSRRVCFLHLGTRQDDRKSGSQRAARNGNGTGAQIGRHSFSPCRLLR